MRSTLTETTRPRMIVLLTVALCASFGFGIFVATSAAAEPAFEGDVELFRAIAMAQRDNAERISSWQGSSRVESSRLDPNGILVREINAYHFVYSREYNATRWHYTPEERYVREGGKLVAKPWEDLELAEMRKGDAFYKYNLGFQTMQGERRGTLVIFPVEEADEGSYGYSFDPMWYLSGKMIGEDNMTAELMRCYRNANDPNFTSPYLKYTLTRNGPLVILDKKTPMGKMISHRVFDLSKGGTMTSYHANVQSMKWTYENKDGCWIPRTCTRIVEYDSPVFDGCTKQTRDVIFIENILNGPVSASEFSLDKLGYQPGDGVTDYRFGL